jgi:hypothetical protein
VSTLLFTLLTYLSPSPRSPSPSSFFSPLYFTLFHSNMVSLSHFFNLHKSSYWNGFDFHKLDWLHISLCLANRIDLSYKCFPSCHFLFGKILLWFDFRQTPLVLSSPSGSSCSSLSSSCYFCSCSHLLIETGTSHVQPGLHLEVW